MQIIAQCPNCGTAWLLDQEHADKRIHCVNCRILFKIPSLKDVPKAMKVIDNAKGRIFVDQDGNTYA